MRAEDVYRRASTWLLVAVACVLVVGWVFASPRPSNAASLRVAKGTYTLEIADTEESRTLGLGGRKSMAADQGMVFVFSSPDRACFWMKDMRFNLDMIWLDANKTVAHIERNASVDSYPHSYCPPKPASYVIELNAGQATRSNMRVGDRLDLHLPQR